MNDIRKTLGDLIHPGEHLAEFLEDFGATQYRLAKSIYVPARRINEIIHGKRRITADTALRLSRFFGTTAEFWMNLQVQYDLQSTLRRLAAELDTIETFMD